MLLLLLLYYYYYVIIIILFCKLCLSSSFPQIHKISCSQEKISMIMNKLKRKEYIYIYIYIYTLKENTRTEYVTKLIFISREILKI